MTRPLDPEQGTAVYVVTTFDPDQRDTHIHGVYSTREKAEEAAAILEHADPVKEMQVDA
jgi:hypothetical protein